MKSHFSGVNDWGKRAPPAGAHRESLFWRERREHGNCSKSRGRHEMKGRGQLAASWLDYTQEFLSPAFQSDRLKTKVWTRPVLHLSTADWCTTSLFTNFARFTRKTTFDYRKNKSAPSTGRSIRTAPSDPWLSPSLEGALSKSTLATVTTVKLFAKVNRQEVYGIKSTNVQSQIHKS